MFYRCLRIFTYHHSYLHMMAFPIKKDHHQHHVKQTLWWLSTKKITLPNCISSSPSNPSPQCRTNYRRTTPSDTAVTRTSPTHPSGWPNFEKEFPIRPTRRTYTPQKKLSSEDTNICTDSTRVTKILQNTGSVAQSCLTTLLKLKKKKQALSKIP